ncbi:MAG: hypothetical protein ACRD2C_25595 [Acidimicrobiales bacterium]
MSTEAAPPDRVHRDAVEVGGREVGGAATDPTGATGATGAMGSDGGMASPDRVPRSARWFVGLILAALVIPGLAGLEAWPLTGWKLFSLSRDESQTVWVLESVAAGGATREVSLEDLPLGYRHAEWPMSELLDASMPRRERACDALLAAIVDLHPATTELRLVRDHQQMVAEGGDWVITHDPEEFHTCRT